MSYGASVVLDSAWKPAKAAALVKILALQPERTRHREQLIDWLWPEADAEAGSSSFYKSMHHLRRAARACNAPDLITLGRGTVTLCRDAVIDVAAFRALGRQALGSGDLGALEGAIAAYGGELLPGDIYESWTEPHRDEFRTLHHRLRLELADRYLHRRRIDDAITHYQQILEANALSEEAHRGLMRAYGAGGQRELALRQYDRCRALLEAELAASPSDETEALLSEIRSVDRLVNRVEAAIAAPVQAGDASVRIQAWSDAIAHYRDAIERLQATDRDDERESELWLKLASVTSAVGDAKEVAEHCRRAVQLAERAGAFDLHARALVRFQAATDAAPNNHAGHREAAELIRSALDRCPPGPSASRAWLLAASARPLAASARSGDEQHVTGRVAVAGVRDPAIEGRLREAVAIARAVGNTEVLAYTLIRLRIYITSPDTLDERLDITQEVLGLNVSTSNTVSEYEARLFRHEDLLESGDLDGARIEARAIRRLGDAARSDGIISVGDSLLATHAIADGFFDEGRALLFESRKLDAQQGDFSNTAYRFGIQMLTLRWHQGRISELYDAYRRAVDVAPRVTAARAALALICAESGRMEDAGAELERLTATPVEHIPKDFNWWLITICMSHAAIAIGGTALAADLYTLLRPYAHRNASTAGAVSFGSASLVLGQLAAFLGRHADAESHFEDALAFNLRTRQRVWTARTRFHYAEMLLTQGAPADVERARDLARIALADARELGMSALASRLSTPISP